MPSDLRVYWNRAVLASAGFLLLMLVIACAIPVRMAYDRDPHGQLIPVAVAPVTPAPEAPLPGFAPATAAVAVATAGGGGAAMSLIDLALMGLGAVSPVLGGVALTLWRNYRRMREYAKSAAELADAHERVAIEAAPPAEAPAVLERLRTNKDAARAKQMRAKAATLDTQLRPGSFGARLSAATKRP